MLAQVQQPVDQVLEDGLMARLVAAKTAADLLTLIEQYNEGVEMDFGSVLRTTVEQFDVDTNRKVKTPLVTDRIEDMLEEDAHNTGLKWRLDEMNDAMRPLRGGDFILVAARPDVGKTSFLTDNLTFMAPQIEPLFPEERRKILWFNNEGPGKRIKKRNYQSALNASMSDLVARTQAGTISKDYTDALGGDADIIQIYDIHDFWHHEVEDIIRQHNPALIVFDMLDNIKFGGGGNNNGQRTDQLLEAMYQWGRVIGVKHDCAVLATSQISADGENLCYPLLSMLKDSKTGKQGAMDAIVTIGFTSEFPSSRYLGFTKNKLAPEGGTKHPKIEVIFDGQRGRYISPTSKNGAM